MADTTLFGRLRRLFSTNVIVRNVGGKKLKIADTDQVQKQVKVILLIDIQNYIQLRFSWNRLFNRTSNYGSKISIV